MVHCLSEGMEFPLIFLTLLPGHAMIFCFPNPSSKSHTWVCSCRRNNVWKTMLDHFKELKQVFQGIFLKRTPFKHPLHFHHSCHTFQYLLGKKFSYYFIKTNIYHEIIKGPEFGPPTKWTVSALIKISLVGEKNIKYKIIVHRNNYIFTSC